MFNSIDIETTTKCNRRCNYCPVSLEIREEKYMETELIDKMIGELAEMRFGGRVTPSLYGEPLLDPRIKDIIGQIHKKVYCSQVVLFTNGDYLTVDMLDFLIENDVIVRITNHNSNGIRTKKLSELMRYAKERKIKNVECRSFINNKSPLHNRCGLIDHELIKPVKVCFPRRDAMYININGDALLCCNDYTAELRMGNIKEKSLTEIWSDDNYVKLRKAIKTRGNLPAVCRRCNCI